MREKHYPFLRSFVIQIDNMEIKLIDNQYHSLGFFYPYHPDTVEFCRMLKTSWGWQAFSYDAAYKAWAFSDPKILGAIVAKYPQVVVGEEVKKFMATMENETLDEWMKNNGLDEAKSADDVNIEIPGLKGGAEALMPFQRVGVDFLVKSGARAILADEPGLGKTVQSIGAILVLQPTRSLIICPATMKYVWENEIKKWSDLSCIVIDSKTVISEIPLDTKVWIVNYDLLKRHLPELIKVSFDFLGLDESHYIKTPNTQRSRYIRLLARAIKYVVMLSGTPVLNRPVEIFNPLNVLDPKVWNDWHRFTERYCGAKRTRFGLDVSGATNTEELKGKLDKYMLRRRKEDVLKDLPDKVRVEIPVELNGVPASEYSKAFHSFAKFLREDKGKSDIEIRKSLMAEKLVRINSLREISANGKLKDAIELIENITEGGEKIVVFASFVAPLKKLAEHFGDRSVLLTGSTENEERFEIVKRFQEDPNVKVFLGGIKSAGVGITLTAASNVLFLDYSWTPADHKQAEDRAHRIGSTHDSITIYQMRAKGTIDDIMFKMLAKKRDVVESLVGEGDDQSSMSMVLEEITNQIIDEKI